MSDPARLGDIVDDYCSRCRLVMNHAVGSLVDGRIARVRCTTCQYEHKYNKGKGGRKKKDDVASLMEQLLSGMPPTPPPVSSSRRKPR